MFFHNLAAIFTQVIIALSSDSIVTLLVEQDEVSDVVGVRLLGLAAEVAKVNSLTDAIAQIGQLRHIHGVACGKRLPRRVLPLNCRITPSIYGVRPQLLANTPIAGVILRMRFSI